MNWTLERAPGQQAQRWVEIKDNKRLTAEKDCRQEVKTSCDKILAVGNGKKRKTERRIEVSWVEEELFN